MDAIDLFAGAGGFSTGAKMAGCRVVWAANHWQAAVDIHAANHPQTLHACQDLHQADWTTVPPHGLLLASPACQGHSRARGAERPHHDAQRSTAWAVVSAAECHQPDGIVVENVPEFADWNLFGPWSAALEKLGYSLSKMVVDAADLGVPQHRRRLFVLGVRAAHPITLRLPRRAHVSARQIIDLSRGQWSRVDKSGRSPNTLARIKAGREQHGQQFLIAYYGNEKGGRSLDRPIGTITTRDRWAIVDGERMRMLSVDECRAAMGFPASYVLPEHGREAVHMLGNAVPPLLAKEVIQAFKSAI